MQFTPKHPTRCACIHTSLYTYFRLEPLRYIYKPTLADASKRPACRVPAWNLQNRLCASKDRVFSQTKFTADPVFCCTSLHIVFCFLLLFPFKESQLTPPSFPFLFLLGAFLELLCRDLRSLRRRLPRRLRRRSHQRLRQRSHQRRPKK